MGLLGAKRTYNIPQLFPAHKGAHNQHWTCLVRRHRRAQHQTCDLRGIGYNHPECMGDYSTALPRRFHGYARYSHKMHVTLKPIDIESNIAQLSQGWLDALFSSKREPYRQLVDYSVAMKRIDNLASNYDNIFGAIPNVRNLTLTMPGYLGGSLNEDDVCALNDLHLKNCEDVHVTRLFSLFRGMRKRNPTVFSRFEKLHIQEETMCQTGSTKPCTAIFSETK